MRKRAAVAAALFVFALGGCADGGDGTATRPRLLTVVPGAVETAYVAGDRLHGSAASRRLRGSVSTTLIANLAPAAVPDAAGGRIAYNSWRGSRPVVRIARLTGGEETVLAEGAYSPSWRRDGAIAYFQALRPDLPRAEAIRRYRGHVVVRERPDAPARRWTREVGRYVVAAWAGERLLAYRITSGWPQLLVLDGPRRVRVLARDAALVAVAPDARRIFVSTYGAAPPLVRIVDVATKRELARRQVPNVRWIVEAGSWRGGRVVASASTGIAVFRVSGGAITLEQLLRLDRRGFPTGVFEPQLSEGGRRVTAWGELDARPQQVVAAAAVVECDLAERRCLRGPEVSAAVGLRLVYNASRP